MGKDRGRERLVAQYAGIYYILATPLSGRNVDGIYATVAEFQLS